VASSTRSKAEFDLVECPACNGAGGIEESYRIKGPDVRIIDCTFCQGSGDVSPEWAAEIRAEGLTLVRPSDWVA